MSIEVRLFIAQFVNILAELLILAIFVRVILSWIRPVQVNAGKFSMFIIEITEPILQFFRKILPKTGMLDLSPIVAFLAIELIRTLILNFL